jgi:hypothetical protein
MNFSSVVTMDAEDLQQSFDDKVGLVVNAEPAAKVDLPGTATYSRPRALRDTRGVHRIAEVFADLAGETVRSLAHGSVCFGAGERTGVGSGTCRAAVASLLTTQVAGDARRGIRHLNFAFTKNGHLLIGITLGRQRETISWK